MPSEPREDPEPAPGEPRETPYQRARRRALELARAQASDEEIAAVLRSELATTRPKALMVATEVDRRVAQWADSGLLEDARTAGKMLAMQRLVELAESDEDIKVSAQAAIYLARRMDEPAPKALADEQRRLQEMTPAQRKAHFLALAAAEGA